jgi:S-(hydroxymethyl)glutathione dehydrogenase / alcohol dehydrogenase
MQKTFKAAVLLELKKPLSIVELYHQSPPEGTVKVKMITSGLCGAQVNEMSGKKGDDKYLPHLMGHEGYGEVVEIGRGVSKLKPGDHVILHWRPASGMSMPGIKYNSIDNVEIGAGPITTFSEYTIVAENRCSVINADEFIALALPLLGCAVSTAYGAVVKEAQVRPGQDVLIYGAGGLGMALLFWCKLLGIENVSVVDIHEGKRPQIEEFGGIFVHAKKAIKNNQYDVIFETSGVVSNVESSLNVARKSAKIVLIGQTGLGLPVKFENFLQFYDEITLIASTGGRFDPDEDLNIMYDLCAENRVLFNSLISHTIRLDQVNEGFELMKADNAKRVIINFRMD